MRFVKHLSNLKIIEIMVMRNIIYVVAFILFGIWGIGFLIYDIGNFIHLSLLAAIVLVVVRLIKGKKTLTT